ncbi:MAG: sulfite oxidase [Anaerolineales bacterium]|nr:sulfite oxidase [Anaerolineales bacterium]
MSESNQLRAITKKPLNAETPLAALENDITPGDLVYVRNHFDIPEIDPGSWELLISGKAENPSGWTLEALSELPQAVGVMTLECAGNGRSGMDPSPPGTPWGFGAVSFVEYRGTSLANVLNLAGIAPDVVEVLFIGADHGEVMPGRKERYARSLPLEVALDSRTALVWELNGQPLTPPHGFPLRLMVPTWYGMASVKWLQEVRLISEPFAGYFQVEHYVYQQDETAHDGEPVREIRPRALITHPVDGAALARGHIEVRGAAWTGHGTIHRVEFSTDNGGSWQPAELSPSSSEFGSRQWRHVWTPDTTGNFVLLARATDSSGNSQPLNYIWNALGYGNNGVRPVKISIT